MDMNELTREEMNARLGTVEERMDARFAEAMANFNARFDASDAKTEARLAETDAKMELRFAQAEAQLDRRIGDLIRWMVMTAIAATGVGIAGLALILNSVTSKPPTPIVISVPAPALPAPPR
jgi:hypothetical protein